MVETLFKGKETAQKHSSKKESSFNEPIEERGKRINEFINGLESLVEFPDDFVKANEDTKIKIAGKGIVQIEKEVLSDLKEDECRGFNKEEKVCFCCFKKENNETMHLYLYYLLIVSRDRFENLLKLNEKKETKLKSINNLFSRKEIYRKGIGRGMSKI